MSWRLAQVLLAAGLCIAEAKASPNAMAKVIEMLQTMAAKATTEQNAEQVEYAEYSQWCQSETTQLAQEIQGNTNEIDGLAASVQKLQSDSDVLAGEIAALDAEITKQDAEKEAATNGREKGRSDFVAQQKDLAESVDALKRAIKVMKAQNYDRPASSLMQEPDDQIPAKVKSMVAAFMATSSDDGMLAAPKANAYEYQSTNIIDMLEKLRADFESQLNQAETEEANAQHAYNMVNQHLTDSIEQSTQDKGEKAARNGQVKQKHAQNQKQLNAAMALKADNEKRQKETKNSCEEKRLSYEEKQKLRTEEISAIRKAVEILSSPEAAGNSGKYLGFAQATSRATSLALRAKTHRSVEQGVRYKVRQFLEAEGERLHSQQLGLLAEKISADPFTKVKQLIDQMITRLLNEANEDAKKEGFCDKEVGKSEKTRTKLNEAVDALTAQIDEGKATITDRSEKVKTLNADVAEIDRSVKQATELRTSEKSQNAVTVEDAKAAQVAVTSALKVLKEFYKTAATATAFIQIRRAPKDGVDGQTVNMDSEEWDSLATKAQGSVDKGHKEGMETFGDTYSGQQDEAGGVVAMLEVILADFATLQADTQNSEVQSQHSYEELMTENKKNRAVKSKQASMNSADLAAARAQLTTDEENLRMTVDQQLAAERYWKSIQDQCVDKGMTFEERTQARASEIKSLKEALRILGEEEA